MKDMPEHERPLSEQYRVIARQYVELKEAADYLDAMKSSELSKRIKAYQAENPGVAFNKAEMEIKASDDWCEYLKSIVAAQAAMNMKRQHMEYIKMRFTEWTETNANARHEARLIKA